LPDLVKSRSGGFGLIGSGSGYLIDHPSSFNKSVDYRVVALIFNHMVELETPRLDAVFHALGDATRRHMLRDLAGGERTVGQLAQPFAISLAAASKHIKALENAGLIRREVRGRTHLCRLEPGPLASAHQWLAFYESFWTGRLDVLERLLRNEAAPKSSTPKKGDNQ
jgi:DNA-binding transcriptional ArsR family regulator